MSQISPLMFFLSENEIFSWTHILKMIPQRTKILISPVGNKILNIWDTLFNLVQMLIFQNRFTTRSWSFWKYHRKRTAKATPKIEKICILYIYREYLLCLQSNASGSFLQKYIFVEQRLKFCQFEGFEP